MKKTLGLRVSPHKDSSLGLLIQNGTNQMTIRAPDPCAEQSQQNINLDFRPNLNSPQYEHASSSNLEVNRENSLHVCTTKHMFCH